MKWGEQPIIAVRNKKYIDFFLILSLEIGTFKKKFANNNEFSKYNLPLLNIF